MCVQIYIWRAAFLLLCVVETPQGANAIPGCCRLFALLKELPGKAAISAWALLDQCVLGQAQLGKAGPSLWAMLAKCLGPGCRRPGARHRPRRRSQLVPKTGFAGWIFWGGTLFLDPLLQKRPLQHLSLGATSELSASTFLGYPCAGGPSSWSHSKLCMPREGVSCPALWCFQTSPFLGRGSNGVGTSSAMDRRP